MILRVELAAKQAHTQTYDPHLGPHTGQAGRFRDTSYCEGLSAVACAKNGILVCEGSPPSRHAKTWPLACQRSSTRPASAFGEKLYAGGKEFRPSAYGRAPQRRYFVRRACKPNEERVGTHSSTASPKMRPQRLKTRVHHHGAGDERHAGRRRPGRRAARQPETTP